jgi:hypothetical protein
MSDAICRPGVTAVQHFHINLGDLPTWLAVVAATCAAAIALWQLRGQQKELTRQLAALERQQANEMEVYPGRQTTLMIGGRGENCWDLTIINNSRRPVRNVASRIEPTPGASLVNVDRAGYGDAAGILLRPGETSIRVLRVGLRAAFLFRCPIREHPDARMTVRFTDDAGLHWQIDHDLALTQLRKRDW